MSDFDSDGVLVVGLIIVLALILTCGLTTCSEQASGLKKTCMELGGTVIPTGHFEFRCETPKLKIDGGPDGAR